ncbi:hypothetical protein C5C18_03005 [Rathayibacter tritici]|uniref:glycosyltransferase family 39 protein n=1 Tax=Rathayibacter tritici TaxID=33888 RepID=UPI000CE7B27D|nr:glycosyltransferase family 39 protein [Rathayibacter tritici]PPF70786.1 hypothetical protein C5C21_00555 [Rathayibacter tritici]PPG08794.1 hypothetical protein C5C18_03005 [Rathayibacter tritici]
MRAIRTLPASVVLVLATALTLVGSWIPSYWNDEVATLRLARLPLDQLLAFVQEKDAVHLVYGLLMHGWIAVAGESEFAVRAPSALATGAAAAGVVLLLRAFDRPRAALLAAAVLVVLPRSSFSGTEARSSALVTALVVGAAVLIVHAARSGGALRWAAFVAVAGLANAVFLYCVLVLPAFVALAVAAAPRNAVRALAASGLSALSAVPVLLLAAGQSGQVGWLRSQPVNAFTVLVEPFVGSAWWLAVIVVVLLGVAAARGALRTPLLPALLLWLALPTAVLVLGTLVVGPMFTPRYVASSAPALAVLTGLALDSWTRRTGLALLALIIAAALPVLVQMRTAAGKPAGQDLRALATAIQERAHPGDAVLLGSSGTVSLQPRLALAAYPEAFAGLDDVAFAHSYAGTGSYSDALLEGEPLRAALAGEDRIWQALPEGESDDVLVEAGFVAREQLRVPTVVLTLWERPGGG